ncbi:MAG: Acyltransferase family protein [Mucilaginibacter sp.]|nr:Acyltransferase family protein [Mucilaginibacter sp.]
MAILVVSNKTSIVFGVQYLRGFAALSVVLCHFGSDLTKYPTLSAIFNFGQNGVFIFFFISGFIIVYSLQKADYKPKQFIRFLLKRSIRIDPSYIVTIICTILLFNILSLMSSFKGQNIPLIPGQFLAHLFYIVPFTKYPFYNHIFWTLCVEFQFYILIGLLYFISSNKIYKAIFLILFSATSLIPFANSYSTVFHYAPIFSSGISMAGIYHKKHWINNVIPVFFLCLIYYEFGIGIFALLSISALVVIYANDLFKPLFALGEISYSLYLTHSLVNVVILGCLKRINVDIQGNQLIWLIVQVTLAIIFSTVFYYLIERPSLRISKRIFYNPINSTKPML